MQFRSLEEALECVVKALGGPKEVGRKLRPEKAHDPEFCRNWLNNCLNSEHAQKLELAQIEAILRWGKSAGCHAAMNYLDESLGYTRSEPLAEDDELVELHRKMVADMTSLHEDMARIQRLLSERNPCGGGRR